MVSAFPKRNAMRRRLTFPLSSPSEDGTHRTSVFHTVLGTGYIATALKLAAAADP